MNYSTFIIKIINKPKLNSFDKNITNSEILGQFYQFKEKNNTFCKISVWGTTAYEVVKYYNKHDYLVVEGYVSFRESKFEEFNITSKMEISAFKVYPINLSKLKLLINQ